LTNSNVLSLFLPVRVFHNIRNALYDARIVVSDVSDDLRNLEPLDNMSSAGRTTRQPVSRNDNDDDDDDNNNNRRRRGAAAAVGFPVWCGLLLGALAIAVAVAVLAISVRHEKNDECSYECTGDDRDRWWCPEAFTTDPSQIGPYCTPPVYSPLATGGEYYMCYWGSCIYFKEWGPMDDYPCWTTWGQTGDYWPHPGPRHCNDMISDTFPNKDRFESMVFCENLLHPVCIIYDKCSFYSFVSEAPLLKKRDGGDAEYRIALDRIKAITDTNTSIFAWGAAKAAENGRLHDSSARPAPISHSTTRRKGIAKKP
jgi:hypothetical protein